MSLSVTVSHCFLVFYTVSLCFTLFFNLFSIEMSRITHFLYTQEADGLVYAYILIWVAKSCGRSATGFEGVFLGFYI